MVLSVFTPLSGVTLPMYFLAGLFLNKKLEASDLNASEIDFAFTDIMDGLAPHEEIKRFLTLTVPRMSDPAWIAGGARSLRARMVRVEAPEGAIDVCGTGGDGAHTLNISTAVAFVVVPVISLTGPEKVAPGSTASYAVLVRDRHGAPLPGADVRLGFWKASFIELASAKSYESGDATIGAGWPLMTNDCEGFKKRM